jgi:hypothetical protein
MTHRRGIATWLAIGSISVFAGCNTPSTPESAAAGARDSAEQVVYGVRSALTHAGLRRGELTADTMLVLDAATRFDLRGVRAVFTSTSGRPLGTLTAAEATFWVNAFTLEARGKVTIVSDTSGRRLEGSWVRYDAAKNELASDSAFVATGRGRLTGVGFTADPGLFTVKCVAQCNGSLSR